MNQSNSNVKKVDYCTLCEGSDPKCPKYNSEPHYVAAVRSTPPDQTLDTTLLNFAKELRYIDEQRLAKKIGINEEALARKGSHNKAKQQIESYMYKEFMELIGKDDFSTSRMGINGLEIDTWSDIRNKLRAELQAAAKDKFKQGILQKEGDE